MLDYCDVKVNESCGLHIHIDAADFTMETWRNLAITYRRLEPVIDGFMPSSRRDNHYCKRLSGISENRIREAQTIMSLRQAFGGDRYHKLNLEAYARHRTVGFRQHGGTTNATCAADFVTKLRESSRFDSRCTDQEYMYHFADRYHNQTGHVVRADSSEHFLEDLTTYGYVNVK